MMLISKTLKKILQTLYTCSLFVLSYQEILSCNIVSQCVWAHHPRSIWLGPSASLAIFCWGSYDDIRCFPFSTSELFSYFTVVKHCFSLCMCDLSALSPIVLISISLSQVLQKHLCLSALNSDNHGLKSSLLSHLIKKVLLNLPDTLRFSS